MNILKNWAINGLKAIVLSALLLVCTLTISVSSASAEVSMNRFCSHLHQFTGANTTYPLNCQPSDFDLVQATFCVHLHKYIGTNTTYPSGDAQAWCEQNPNPGGIVPEDVYCTHLHQWGGNNTTFPIDPSC
ncbi:MAG: hypothetical protein F6K50_43280 [Moorea sp. SIO3I7]|uniref:hypothetical protein n=1 Tax=unclassified Moorena TaxID=2683338 RepID=UPI0013C235E0|nr:MULTISPECIES: hypothetical protein [unclassified Moorena]NEO01962.1 hypothetical protein [Moorena sp. SIO3I7]NEO09869.1 hypothetical protein [Moorena sp. SIO3I8]NEP28391.1 hypothetical protein [Moorena sp. SIO3I6]NEQ57840.1 hypothetical protein [Moorena sp. SIO4A1]